MEKKYFNSYDNESIPYLHFESVRNDLKNNVIIFHGMTEPMTRYEEFGNFLSANGYNVYVMELRGHGELRSYESSETVNEIKENGNSKKKKYGDLGKKGIKGVFEDIEKFWEILVTEYNINRENTVILGHSMGSLIAMEMMIKLQYKNLIISGFPLKNQIISISGLLVTYLERLLIFKKESIFNNQFEKNAKYFEPYDDINVWLTRDKEEVRKYTEDENCGYPVTPKFFAGIFKMMIFINKKYKKIAKDARILSVYGTDDKVVDMKHMNKILTKLKKQKKKISVVSNENGRHESLNEINKYAIYDEILKWINEIIK